MSDYLNEEENNEKDANKTIELIVLETNNEIASLLHFEKKKNNLYYFKYYKPFYLDCVSPPPDYI
ncbi:MAG: hypothetical protein ACPG6B_09505 [Oceanihabitans sp.]